MNNKLNHNPDLVNQLDISTTLLDWYDQHARNLPWRVPPFYSKKGLKPDPYRIWISEIMLQQTGVKTVEPYFLKFMKKWPNIFSLQQADELDVLSLWSGLGYYRRARNLKACAEIVCTEYKGYFPKEEKLLQKLPGIGKYTAAAIRAIAFGIPSVVVDGNVERIAARLFNLGNTLEKSKSKINNEMMMLSPNNRPGDFAQAMMDLGATICKPANPKCPKCPIQNYCIANKKGSTSSIPKRNKKISKVLRRGYVYLGITKSNKIVMVVRPKKGLLGGMICPPSSMWTEGDYPENDPAIPGTWVMLEKTIKHSFTHFDLELRVMMTTISRVPKNHLLKPFNLSITDSLPSVMKKAVILGLKNWKF